MKEDTVMKANPTPAPPERIDYNFSKFAAKGFNVERETNRPHSSIGVLWLPWKRKPVPFRSFASVCASSARSSDRPKVLKGLPATSGRRVHLLASEQSQQTARAKQARARRGDRHDSDSESRKGAHLGRSGDFRPDFRTIFIPSVTPASNDAGQQESRVM
jgi:hypothetical protein